MMKTSLFSSLMLVCVVGSLRAVPVTTDRARADNDVIVTVTYRGAGIVDAKHNILVFLFNRPKIDATTQPIARVSVETNGQKAVFKSVATTPVYVAAVYNQDGGYDGMAGPPPDGTPIGFYRLDPKGDVTPVEPGVKAVISLTFDDSIRWNKH
jgi:hypothetical protein